MNVTNNDPSNVIPRLQQKKQAKKQINQKSQHPNNSTEIYKLLLFVKVKAHDRSSEKGLHTNEIHGSTIRQKLDAWGKRQLVILTVPFLSSLYLMFFPS